MIDNDRAWPRQKEPPGRGAVSRRWRWLLPALMLLVSAGCAAGPEPVYSPLDRYDDLVLGMTAREFLTTAATREGLVAEANIWQGNPVWMPPNPDYTLRWTSPDPTWNSFEATFEQPVADTWLRDDAVLTRIVAKRAERVSDSEWDELAEVAAKRYGGDFWRNDYSVSWPRPGIVDRTLMTGMSANVYLWRGSSYGPTSLMVQVPTENWD